MVVDVGSCGGVVGEVGVEGEGSFSIPASLCFHATPNQTISFPLSDPKNCTDVPYQ
jgi:hypothetical protein